MSEEKNVNYGEIKEKIKDLQLTVLVNFFECAMYQKYGAGWKEKIIKKAKDKVIKNDHGFTYKKLVQFYDNNGDFEITNLEISVTVALIEYDFLQDCCKYKSLPNKILKSKVDKLREDRNKEAHSPLERDDYKKCEDTLNNLEEFMDFLEEYSWKFEASKNFIKYLRGCGRDIDKEISFLENARNSLVNYRAFLNNIYKSKKINDYKTLKVYFVDEKQKSLDGVSCTIISNLNHVERGRFDEVKRFSILLEPGEYSIVCNSVPEGYKEFTLKQLQIEAAGETDVDIAITIEKKNGNNHYMEVETNNFMEGSELIFNKGCEAYNYSKEHNTDYTKAFRLFKEAADRGHIGAKFNLGKMYFNGEGVVEDWTEALKYLEESAKNGYIDAQYYLGRIFMEGTEVEKDEQKALKYIRKSAEFGNAEAQCYLGKYYGQGRDYEQAVKWYEKAAAQGNAYALCALGDVYRFGITVDVDLKKAFDFFYKSATLGCSEGMMWLGDMYLKGTEVLDKDEEKAVEWYEKAAAQGNAYAINQLSICYENGLGVDVNHEVALKYRYKAAELGNAEAQCLIGASCSLKGDLQTAVEWYKKAADKDNICGLMCLGEAYYDGGGIDQNYKEAFKCFKKAADQGDAEGMSRLGEMYLIGLGVEQEDPEAFYYFQESAKLNNSEAEFWLGYMYENGRCVLRADYNEALKWYTKASDHGNIDAAYALGKIYLKGEIVKQDYKKAYSYLKKSVENKQGETRFYSRIVILREAQYCLGYMYQCGLGVEVSGEDALKWYSGAYKLGYQSAGYNIALMYLKGEIIEKNEELARRIYQNLAEKGHMDSQCMLGRIYELGIGIETNIEEALIWYIKAGEQGDKIALSRIWSIYFDRYGSEKYQEIAFECIKKNADNDMAEAEFYLGSIYANQLMGIKQNGEEALKWYIKASEQNYIDAMFNIGEMYYFEEGVEKDDNKAFEWYKKAAECDHKDATMNLGRMYQFGEGVERNVAEAFKCYQKIASLGDLEAKLCVGTMYLNGMGVNKDENQAFKYIYEAAINNLVPAMGFLGYLYEKGFGTDKNIKQAQKWYEIGAQCGDENAKLRLKEMHIKNKNNIKLDIDDLIIISNDISLEKEKQIKAQYQLGQHYEQGICVSRNLKEAAHYYRLAANNDCQEAKAALINLLKQYPNLADAENPICLMDYLSSSKLYNDANYQYKIALCYEHGVDCEKNIQEAFSWYKKAAKQGYQLAQDACERLEQSYPELAPKKTTGFWGKLFG